MPADSCAESFGHSLEVGCVAFDRVLVDRARDELDPAGGDRGGHGRLTVRPLPDSEVAGKLREGWGVSDEVGDSEDVEVGRVGGGVVVPGFRGLLLARNPLSLPPYPPPSPPRARARSNARFWAVGPPGRSSPP